jgi:TonB-dependent starch-binding outer membrane protein SusC
MKKRGKDLPESLQRALRERGVLLRKVTLLLFLVVSMGLVAMGTPEITNPESGDGDNDVTALQTPAQEKTVRGIITDTNKQPMPGVTVQLKGTTIGTLTDVSGAYQISDVSPNSILVVSFIGMATKEIPIGDQTEINVTLSESTLNLEEVVVIGYGTQRRQEVTGAVGSVKEDGFNKGVILSPEQLMQGKVSGVNITSRSGEPGEEQTIVIRGPGTVRSGGPLYVIDGVPIDNASTTPSVGSALGTAGASNPLIFLNPADIASIDVLKDASSTAIYGSRGANGVIMITTKKGSATEQFNYSTSLSISQVASKLKVMSRDEFIDYTTQLGDPSILKDSDTDWFDQIYRTAFTQNHNISFGGGSEKSKYYASISYLDQEGVVEKSEMKRYTGKISAEQKLLNDRINIKFNLTASHVWNDSPPSGDGGNANGELFTNTLNANPTYPTHNPDGSIYQFPDGLNPVMLLDMYTDFRKTNRVLGNVEASVELFKGLQYKINVALDNSLSERIGQSKAHNIPDLQYNTGRLGQANVENNNQIVENYLTYGLQQGKHKLDLLLGHSYQRFKYQSRGWSINGFSTTEIEAYNNPSIGTTLDIANNKPSGSATINELQSFFARANYNLNSRYILTATARMDGSSKFGGNNRYAFFPSFGAAWRISEEDFLADADAVNNLTLRFGWGVTGNQEIPPKITKAQLSVSTGSGVGYPLDGTNIAPGFNFVRIPNKDIRWEVSRQSNIGIDFSFFKDRLYGTLDAFDKVSTDILWETTTAIDPITPTGSNWNNYDMKIINRGIEMALGFRSGFSETFQWDFGGNISYIYNTIQDLPVTILRTGTLSGPGLTSVPVNGYMNGQPIGTFYILEFLGLDEDGFSIFRDAKPDGVINDDDRVVAGSALPKIQYNLYGNLTYKKVGLVLNFNGAAGNKIYNETENAWLTYPIFLAGNNVPKYVIENSANENPLNSSVPSTRYLYDGDFLRLNNATISYNLGNTIWKLASINLYLTGQNLFVITKYPGNDPEVDTPKSSGGFRSYGIDYTSYPKSRTYIFGASITF